MLNGYIAVGNKCAVDFTDFNLSITTEEVLAILWQKGFRGVEIDLVDSLRKHVGSSRYRRGAYISQAPFVMDCSTLTKWAYGQIGIWLPRHSIDQRAMGRQIEIAEIEPGDLIFSVGAKPYWYADPNDGVGHVGICTGQGSVIHAASTKRGIVEDSLEVFVSPAHEYRGIRRIKTPGVVTLESPTNRMVEWSGEFRNILAQNLPRMDEAL